MKDQYFGDVNDYLKYGILRELSKGSARLHVVWMLTPSDGSADGKFTEYLSGPEKWRNLDPELFDFLRSTVVDRDRRSVRSIEGWDGLPAGFSSKLVPDNSAQRQEWFAEVQVSIGDQSVVFFDPDNGIEVKSRPFGRKNSSKYVYWKELSAVWDRGASLLVYQHFTREPRARFLERLSQEFKDRIGAERVFVLRTSRVAFFLVPQTAWMRQAERHATEAQQQWCGHIGFEEVVGPPTRAESASV